MAGDAIVQIGSFCRHVYPYIILIFVSFCSSIETTSAHGLLSFPNQRGSLSRSKYIRNPVDNNAVQDGFATFPAGTKGMGDVGQKSQVWAAGSAGWTLFEPFKRSFRWRFGICGDTIYGNQHLRGGRFYNEARITGTFRQGGLIDIGMSILANHKGYVEFHICDVEKCGGEIRKECFWNGFCFQLRRHESHLCQKGTDRRCGPIDRKHPGRWYMGCDKTNAKRDLGWQPFGMDRTILYKLPVHLKCDHCVLQWYWVAAHRCNAPGLVQYHDGPDAPKWNNCSGGAGNVGGVNRRRKTCGGNRFPQEYIQCADVKVNPSVA